MWNDTVISARNLIRILQSALMDLHNLKSNCKAHTKFRDHIVVSRHEITKTLKYMKLLYFRRGKFFDCCQWQAVPLTIPVKQGLLENITFAHISKKTPRSFFVKKGSSLLCLKEPLTDNFHQTDSSNPQSTSDILSRHFYPCFFILKT